MPMKAKTKRASADRRSRPASTEEIRAPLGNEPLPERALRPAARLAPVSSAPPVILWDDLTDLGDAADTTG
jgi:hypothetical protein